MRQEMPVDFSQAPTLENTSLLVAEEE